MSVTIRLVTGVVVLTGLSMLALLWSVSQPAPRQRSNGGSVSPGATSFTMPAVPGTATGPRPPAGLLSKTPVSGAPGYFVVRLADNSSYLEAPDGSRQALKAATAVNPALEKTVTDKVTAVAAAPVDVRPENLYFLDQGVIAVPTGAVVTFVGKDHVVVLEDLGTVVYYADGRDKEVRERRAKP